MDKSLRIKRYLEGRNREKPINIDLSKVVDTNHSKTFATKKEVGNQLILITNDYQKRIKELEGNNELTKTQLMLEVELLNARLGDQINKVLGKIDNEKLKLSNEILGKLEKKSIELSEKIELSNEPIYSVINQQKKKVIDLQESLSLLGVKLSGIIIPKEVRVKAGKNVKVDTKETDKTIEYTISSKAEQNIHMLHNMGVQQIIPGANITVSPADGKGTVTISSTASGVSSAGSTFYAGTGIEISGSTITNTLPGVSLQAGNNILIQGVTISATNAGVSLTDNLPEGVSNFYYRPDRFVGIGGASVSYAGLTLTVYAQSTGSPAWGDITGTLSSQTDLYEELVTKLSGTSTTDLLNEGVSNFYYKPSNFTGTGGVSVSVSGKTVTIYGLSTALNTNQITEGTSNFYYTEARFTSSLGTKTTNNLSEGSSALYYSQQRFDSAFAGKNTDNLTEGVSNFYYKPAYLIGTGGVSISISGKTVTVYGLSTALDQTTLGLSSFGEKSYNSLTDQPDLTVYAKGTSLFGLYILGTSFHSAVTVADSTTIDLGISSNQAITASVIQTGLGLSALGEKSYNSLDNKLGFVGTGGVSVSLSGSTYTIYGLSTAINSDQVSEGNSNFYYKGTYFAGIGGASVTVAGKTVTIYAQSTGSPAWGDITGDLSSQTDLYAELVTKLSGSSTTDLLNEGVSNFYYKPSYFTGTGGVSISIAGKTVTVYGLSSAINSNQVSEGTSNFYYRVDRLASDTGISVYKNGVTAKIGVVQADINTNNITEGNSGLFYSIARFNSSFATKNTNDLTEGISNFYYTETRFNSSLATKTSNDISEGTSNFYYKPSRFVGTGGVSVSYTGITLTVYGNSTALNTNNAVEGGSGLFYSTQRFSSDFATKTTNDLTEGTSNFYYNPTGFVGTGGASVSVSGKTITIYASSSGSAAGASGEIQYNDGGNLGATSLLRFSAFEDTLFVKNVKGNNSDISITNDVGGHVSLTTNNGISGTNVGNIYLTAGSGIDNANAGDIRIFAGNGASSFDSGYISIYSGSNYNSGIGGDLNLRAGAGSDANSGSVYISAGTGNAGDANGGNVYIDAGTKSGNGIDGYVLIRNANYGAILGTTYLTAERTYAFPDASGSFALLEAIKGTGGVSVSVSGASITIFGLSRGIQLSKSVYLEGVTNTDLIPFLRVEQNMLLEKTVYDVSGGTQWVGQVQKWNNAQGASKYNTQAADSGVTTTLTVTSYSGATVLTGEYLAIKGSSIYGGISWLLVNIYYREY